MTAALGVLVPVPTFTGPPVYSTDLTVSPSTREPEVISLSVALTAEPVYSLVTGFAEMVMLRFATVRVPLLTVSSSWAASRAVPLPSATHALLRIIALVPVSAL